MNASFDPWLHYCFTRGNAGFACLPEPYGDTEIPAREITEHLIRLFEAPAFVADRYSSSGIAAGIEYIFSSESAYFYAVREEAVPRDLQIRCYRGLTTLYREMFDRVCRAFDDPNVNLESIGKAPVEAVVTMIWDMGNVEGAALWPEFSHLVDPCFEVLEASLYCRAGACRISGLHGLGHLKQHHPERVEQLVTDFLEGDRLPNWLRDYAEAARGGYVL